MNNKITISELRSIIRDELSGKDWNEGHPDHEGEMAVSQLHRIEEMASMLLEFIGEEDSLPGWVQYKLSRAYTDLNDAFGYIESKHHEDTGMMDMQEAKKKKGSCSACKGKNNLWCNVCRKKQRGESPAKPGDKDYPDEKSWKAAQESVEESSQDVMLEKKSCKGSESSPVGSPRQRSFCARMCGMKKKRTGSKTAEDRDSCINQALRRWKCRCS